MSGARYFSFAEKKWTQKTLNMEVQVPRSAWVRESGKRRSRSGHPRPLATFEKIKFQQ
ncbi:hypothetical protein [Kaarinaea lacus]